MPSKNTVLCNPDSQGVLIPHPTGRVPVILTKQNNEGDTPTGTINWNGGVRAFVTFDLSGRMVVGYTCTDQGLTSHITQKSIENLLNYFPI